MRVKNRMNKRTLKIIFWLWLVSAIILNLVPFINDISTDINIKTGIRWDYLFHFGFYFIGIYIFWQWKLRVFYKKRKVFIILFLISWIIFSSFNEYIQQFIPGRSFNPIDLIMNISGVSAASLVSWFMFQSKLRKAYFFGRYKKETKVRTSEDRR